LQLQSFYLFAWHCPGMQPCSLSSFTSTAKSRD
jgi:hypothetical protein